MRFKKRIFFFGKIGVTDRTMRTIMAIFLGIVVCFGPLTNVVRADTASLTINNATSGNFIVGQPWTLSVSSTMPNQAILLCGVHPSGGLPVCVDTLNGVPLQPTGVNGDWSISSSFLSSTIGDWTEWVEFPNQSNLDSNHITFTVQPAPAPTATLTANGQASITVPPDTSVTYVWGSSNGSTSAANLQVYDPAGNAVAGDPCNANVTGPWSFITGLSGSSTGMTAACQLGYRYAITYTVTGATGVQASSIVTVTVANAVANPICTVNCGGTAPATLTISSVLLPSGTTTVPYAATLNVAGTATGPFTWSIASGTLPFGLVLGTSTGVTVSITGTPTATGTYPFVATVTNGTMTATQAYVVTIGSSVPSNCATGNCADIAVVTSVDNANPVAGDTVHYLVTATALGPATSTFVDVHDLLPAGLSLLNATTSQGLYNLGTGDWNIGTMSPNATATLAIAVAIDPRFGGQAIVDAATISELGSLIDNNTANNSSSISISVHTSSTSFLANLGVVKVVDNSHPNAGDVIHYLVTVSDAGPASSTNVVATDTLPFGLTFVHATTSQGSYASTTGTWLIGNMPVSSTATLAVAALVAASSGATIVNTVNVEGTPDPSASVAITVASSSSGSSCTLVAGCANLSITKSVDNLNPAPSAGANYTITVNALGPATSTGVVATDVLPAGLNFMNATTSVGSYSSATGIWTIGDMSAGSTATLRIATVVNAAVGAVIVNGATVGESASSTNQNPSGSLSSSTITIAAPGCTSNCGGNTVGSTTAGGTTGGVSVGVGSGPGGTGGGLYRSFDLSVDGGVSTIATTTVTLSPPSVGQVLAASSTCGVYLTSYISPMRKDVNNPNEVKKLQIFLNDNLEADLPVTGYYGPLTIAAVNRFQVKYRSAVLAPWVPYGLPNDTTPTGYVYKTTQSWINFLVCPSLGFLPPQLGGM